MSDITSRPTINVGIQTNQSITTSIGEKTQAINGDIKEAVLRGYSAYEIAVRNGFVGTEEEWIASLKGETGGTGPQGQAGQDGSDGFSPSASVSQTAEGATITITDKDGTTTATVADGQDGADGSDGYSPSASVTKSNGVATITVTDKTGTTTATVSDGQDGSPGAAGADGFSPSATVTKSGNTATITITDKTGTTTATITDGQDGKDGKDGSKGDTGVDGYSPSASVTKTNGTATITITDKNGTTTATISDGQTGATGATGASGADGYSPTVTVTEITDGHRVAVTDKNGTQTFDVMDGQGIEETVTTDSIPYSLNGYINSSGEFTENAYTVATDFAPLKNATKIEITGANTSSGAMGYAFYGSSHNFLSGVGGLTEDVTLTTFPAGAAYVRMSSRKSGYNPVAVITYSENALLSEIEEDISEIKADIDQLETVKPLSSKIFRRIGCIGDSYTAGYIDNGTTVTLSAEEYAWPYHMSKLTGQTWTDFGRSGSTAKSWMARGDYSRLDEVEAAGNKCQAYVIGLMINDSNESSPRYSPIGTAADIGTDANSYYAYYYKLIKAVNAVNATAPIFCCTCPRTDEARFVTYNVAVRDLVDYCYDTEGLPAYLLDLADNKYNNAHYYKNPEFTGDALRGHFSPIGYEYMAECLIHVMSDVINANVADFQNVHLIPYDEEILTDDTLTVTGQAADAKATGDKIRLALPLETVSGSTLDILDGSDLFPAESCKVAIEPYQDLHGYDHPWPPIDQKNLYNVSTSINGYYISATGVITTSNGDMYSDLIPVEQKTYTFSGHCGTKGSTASNNKRIHGYDINGNWVSQITFGSVDKETDFVITFTISNANIKYIRISQWASDTYIQVEEGDTATEYEAFEPMASNVCPILGWSSVDITNYGGNKLLPLYLNSNYGGLTIIGNSDGSISVSGTASGSYSLIGGRITPLPAGTYVVTIESTLPVQIFLRFGSEITGGDAYIPAGSTRGTKTINSDVSNYSLICNGLERGTEYNFTITGLRLWYNPSTTSVTLPTTVYGGSLDLPTGELIVDRAMIASYNGETLPGEWISDRDVYAEGATPTTGAQVVYKLNTPVTYQLIPQEYRLVNGENMIKINCGDAEISYRADIQRYIDKKLAEVEALILEN